MKKLGFLFLFAFALSCQPKEEISIKSKLNYGQIIEKYNSVFDEA